MADLPALPGARWVPFSQRQVRDPAPRPSWVARAWSTVTTWVRSVGTPTPASRLTPPKPGITAGRVASSPLAEQDLAAMGSSPTVYAAVTRRAYSFGCYPKRVTLGLPRPGAPAKELGTETPWVAALYRLLETPDPSDTEALAPVPGEYLQAQAFADLMLIGVAWIIPTVTEKGDIVGLTRFHPRMVTIIRRDGEDYVECRTSSGQVLLYRYRDELREAGTLPFVTRMRRRDGSRFEAEIHAHHLALADRGRRARPAAGGSTGRHARRSHADGDLARRGRGRGRPARA